VYIQVVYIQVVYIQVVPGCTTLSDDFVSFEAVF